METHLDVNTKVAFPLEELDQIETTIGAMQALLGRLVGRRDALTAELERVTRPILETAAASLPPKEFGPGYEYRGQMIGRWFYIDIYVDVLRRLWADFPHRRDAIAKAMRIFGSTRTYVASRREDLFRGKPTAWMQRNSKVLLDDWYVDTNLGLARMKRLLPIAVKATGLKWGEDIKVYWRRTTLERNAG